MNGIQQARTRAAADRRDPAIIAREAMWENVASDNRLAAKLIDDGWTYSKHVGEFGGFARTVGQTEQLFCREGNGVGPWLAFIVSTEDGETLSAASMDDAATLLRILA